MENSRWQTRLWRRVYVASASMSIACFVGLFAYTLYLEATRPNLPSPEQGMVVPMKIFSGLTYVQPFEKASVSYLFYAGLFFFSIAWYCRFVKKTGRGGAFPK
jgi:hypothetical protein